jgi:hypothetical protein
MSLNEKRAEHTQLNLKKIKLRVLCALCVKKEISLKRQIIRISSLQRLIREGWKAVV